MKRVLVTGASGFVGRQALRPLLQRGFEVHAAGRDAPAQCPPAVAFHKADLLDCGGHRALLEQVRPTHLLHMAWYAEHGKFWDAVENVAWLKATLSLVDAFCEAGGARAVGAGTCAEYDWGCGVLVEGETPELPATLYGSATLCAGRHAAARAGARDVGFAWGRIFFPYGPGEPQGRLVPSVIASLLSGEPARCTDGTQLRDFLYVADVGDAMAALLDSRVAGAVNIGSGAPVAVGEVASRIAAMIGRPELLMLGALPQQAREAPMVVASTLRLADEVGWRPTRSLDQGLGEAIRWWKEQAVLR